MPYVGSDPNGSAPGNARTRMNQGLSEVRSGRRAIDPNRTAMGKTLNASRATRQRTSDPNTAFSRGRRGDGNVYKTTGEANQRAIQANRERANIISQRAQGS